MYKSNKVKLKTMGSYLYIEKDNVIQDKVCPCCNKLIIENKDFCECGFFLKAARNSSFWSAFLSVWVVIGIILLIGLVNFNHVKTLASKQMQKTNLNVNSFTPVNIQIIASLKNSSFDGYIQSIYVKSKEDHKLMILIKPSLWNTLTSTEKKDLITQLTSSWNIIYKQNNPGSKKKPEVNFANYS